MRNDRTIWEASLKISVPRMCAGFELENMVSGA